MRNTGADIASGRWLLFLDADTRVTTEHLMAVQGALSSSLAGAGVPVSLDAPLSRFYTVGMRSWNTLSRRFRVATGCFVLARAELHRGIGGFDERVYAGDQIWYSRALRREGRRLGLEFRILAVPPVISSARKVDLYSPWQHLLVLLTFLLFPWAGRFQRLSWFWYRRPE